jgi:2-polyprenyl-6-methoxyphenol hydroxylase-like FAD-dependent oxidoreductase
VTNDPVGGQGANLGSASAALLAEAICQDVVYDEWFCREAAGKLWALAEPVTNFSDSLMVEPRRTSRRFSERQASFSRSQMRSATTSRIPPRCGGP